MYDSPGRHQDDNTGNRHEDQRPLYVALFFEYFDYCSSHATQTNSNERQREMNIRVNRSLIGQQPALTSVVNGNNQLLSSRAPQGQERGSGNIAGEIDINITSVQTSNITNDESIVSPQRPTPPTPEEVNNGRGHTTHAATTARRNIGPNDGRTRRQNIQYGINNGAFLPPSVRNSGVRSGSQSIDRMEDGYNMIASSIHHLSMQGRLRRISEIDEDIINTIREKDREEANGASRELIQSLENKLVGLQEEKRRANQYDSMLMQNMNYLNTYHE